jgi:hypothetical protein
MSGGSSDERGGAEIIEISLMVVERGSLPDHNGMEVNPFPMEQVAETERAAEPVRRTRSATRHGQVNGVFHPFRRPEQQRRPERATDSVHPVMLHRTLNFIPVRRVVRDAEAAEQQIRRRSPRQHDANPDISDEDVDEEHRYEWLPSQTSESLVRLFFRLMAAQEMFNQQAAAHFQGQPPASAEAQNALPRVVKISTRQLERCPSCTICMDSFDEDMCGARSPMYDCRDRSGETLTIEELQANTKLVVEMPCRHLYHQSCLFRWFETSNQCPTCRYELMTDNPEYNQTVRERMAARRPETLADLDVDSVEGHESGVKRLAETEVPVIATPPRQRRKLRHQPAATVSSSSIATTSTTTTSRYSLRSIRK